MRTLLTIILSAIATVGLCAIQVIDGKIQVSNGLILTSPVTPTGWDDPNTNDLVAVYYMQDTNGATAIQDSWTNGFDGTPLPSVATGPTYTNLGARLNVSGDEIARVFDGVNDNIDLGDEDEFTFGNNSSDFPMSIFAWIKRGATGIIHAVINKTSPTLVEYFFHISATGNLQMTKYGQNSTANRLVYFSTATITDTDWHHVGFTTDGSTNGVLWIDGKTVESTYINAGSYNGMQNTAAPCRIGINYRASSTYFEGLIDDVKIYGSNFSSNDVWQLYFNTGYTNHANLSIENRLGE